jgi:organic radical activating enzyme
MDGIKGKYLKRGINMFGTNSIVGKRWFKDAHPDQMFVTSMFMTLQGEGPYRGEPAFFIRLAKCNLDCQFCFPANTKITMGNGKQKKITDVKIGDEVVAWDERTQLFVKGNVSKTFKRQTDKLVKINLNSGHPTWCTPEHPFLVKNKGWVKAQDLVRGDILLHFSVSDSMTLCNPMFNPKSKAKTTSAVQDIDRRVKTSNRMRQTYAEHPTMRNNLIERMSGDTNPMKNPAVAAKGFLSREDRGRKTGVEKRFEIITANMPIKFVGDGSLPIQHKFPDFVVEGQKKVIEVWASDALHAKNRNEEWMKQRANIFAKEGYETLFVPIAPGTQCDTNKVRELVAEFINNGEIVESIEFVAKGSGVAWTKFAGSKFDNTNVYNFEVDKNHTYIANGKIVHNCDTFFDDGDWLTFDEITERIETTIEQFYTAKNIERPDWTHSTVEILSSGYGMTDRTKYTRKRMVLVMTGGEPMLQNNIGPFLEFMSTIFVKTQIESNGTQNTVIPDSTTLVCSPKCLEKKKIAVRYLKPRKEIMERADCLKFVMEANPDSPYSDIPVWAHEWAVETGRQIYISPMNIYNDVPLASKKLRLTSNSSTMEQRSTIDEIISFWEPGLLNMKENQINHEYSAAYCIQYGYILNLQIHLYCSMA